MKYYSITQLIGHWLGGHWVVTEHSDFACPRENDALSRCYIHTNIVRKQQTVLSISIYPNINHTCRCLQVLLYFTIQVMWQSTMWPLRHQCSAPAQRVLWAAILAERSIFLLSCFIIKIYEHKPCNKQYLYSILATILLVCMWATWLLIFYKPWLIWPMLCW